MFGGMPFGKGMQLLVEGIHTGMGSRLRVLLVALSFFAVIGVVAVSWFGSALFQEGNLSPILAAIMRLEFGGGSGMESFAESDRGVRYVMKSGDPRYGPVKDYMKVKGWGFKEQMGSGLIFMKKDQTLIVETRQYSRHYILVDVPQSIAYDRR